MAKEPMGIPIIAEDDYEAFRKIIQSLPDTYAGWLEMHEQAKREHGKSYTVLEELVHPNEFVAYCNDRRVKPSEESLWMFARDKVASPMNGFYGTH